MDDIERRIKDQLKKKLYFPLLVTLQGPKSTLSNSAEDESVLWHAMQSGKITFNRGTFSGKFDAKTTRALKSLGAKWDRSDSVFKIQLAELPLPVQATVMATQTRFEKRLAAIDIQLAKVVPSDIAEHLKLNDLFDKTVWQVDKDFRRNTENIVLEPELSKEARLKIATEWENNLKLDIVDFARKQILELRSNIEKSYFAGNRYGNLIKQIETSYDQSANHAKFLARQETKLLTAKYAETRYTDAGLDDYIWKTVVGSPAHPVRHDHAILNNTPQKWSQPPVTNQKTKARNNPGQDYGCRCRAVPIVSFKVAS
jgi:hypothetical protein